MKNIFSNFGTKKVAGVVLAGATLLVGLGVVNNFSSSSQKAANEAALSRFGESAYNNFVGGSSASRADLERQMSATQAGYGARFLKGKSEGVEPDEALSSDGAYAEGIRSNEGFVYGPGSVNGGAYGEGGVYNPINSTYEQNVGGQEFEGYDGKGSGYGEAQFQAAEAAAAAAAKAAKGQNAKGGKGGQGNAARGIRPATQINKMAASDSKSTFGAGTGGSGGMSGGSASFDSGSTGSSDNNTRALPQANAQAGISDGNAFKFGRAGGMGGFSADFKGAESRGGHNRSYSATTDMQMAAVYSNKAVASNKDVGQKSLAEAAFDGSNPEDITPTIPEGASIGQVASTLMSGSNINLPDAESLIPPEVQDTLKETMKQQQELLALQKKISNKLLGMIIAVAAMAVGLFFLVKAAYSAPWPTNLILFIAASVLSTAALLTIAGCLWWGDNSIIDMIKQMGDQDKFGLVNQGIDVGGKITSTYMISAELALLLGMCWIPWGNIGSASEIVQLIAKGAASTLVGNVVQGGISEGINNSNINKQVKATKEQAKQSAQNGTNNP